MAFIESFGVTARGEKVNKCILKNKNGVEVHILNYGCALQKWLVPDAGGTVRDIVLGYDTLAEYEKGTCFFGVVVGRYANRIRNAAFTLGGKTYTLPVNDGENHLHGTYERSVFEMKAEGDSVLLSRVSPDGEEGYPGSVSVQVRYTLTEENTLRIEYKAETDSETVINLTNHSYFNLNGQDGSDILSHELAIHAGTMTEGGPGCIPTGKIIPVQGTAMDFTAAKPVGRDMFLPDPNLEFTGGYDHNYCIDGKAGVMREAAKLSSPVTGLMLTCRTTQPGMQFYAGLHVHEDAVRPGKAGVVYPQYGGLALETQHYPCSPNFPQFPSTVLRPGETYREVTEYEVR